MTAISEPINVTNPKMKTQLRRKRRMMIIGGAILGLGALTFLAAGTGLKSMIFDAIGIDHRPPKPLKISKTEPIYMASDVPVDHPIVLTFYKTDQTIDPSTINNQSVMLVETGLQKQIDIDVSFEGAPANTITIKPKEKLRERTNYNVLLTGAIQSKKKGALEAYITSFTTGGPTDPDLVFEKIALPTTSGVMFTCLKISPDRKLWASSADGLFYIFDINEDGTLGAPKILDAIQKDNSGPRLITGFDFDPASTASNPIIWASNCYPEIQNAPDFSSKITRLEGPELERVDDVIIDLPRSIGDHATNQPSFGPDGALYIPQASNSAFGAPDLTWGMREEHLLSATILRLDTKRLKLGYPISVRTPDASGKYDPKDFGAPLTIYADGFRLAYDMLWHRNGSLYVAVNGSSSGGNTPEGGGAPAINGVSTAEDDWLFKVKPGKYHGHPNPSARRFVFNGGNPTVAYDFAEQIQYPIGTKPDPNWNPAIYVFGQHTSPDGMIEYKGDALGGKLDGRIMVCRYSNGSDVIVLTLDGNGNISRVDFGLPGLSDFNQPLDLIQDEMTGYIYVSEFGAKQITLVKPSSSQNPS